MKWHTGSVPLCPDASNVVEGETTDANVFPEEELLPEEILNRYDDTSSPFPF